jgi:hypothetical protein
MASENVAAANALVRPDGAIVAPRAPAPPGDGCASGTAGCSRTTAIILRDAWRDLDRTTPDDGEPRASNLATPCEHATVSIKGRPLKWMRDSFARGDLCGVLSSALEGVLPAALDGLVVAELVERGDDWWRAVALER